MSRDSNGNAVVNRQRAVSGQTVLAEQVNVPFDDIQSMFNLVSWRDGLAPMTGNLNMNGFKITNLPEALSDSEPVQKGQFDNALSTALTGVNRVLSTKSGSYTASDADYNKIFRFTTSATLSLNNPASGTALRSAWICEIWADGGNVTVDPDDANTVNTVTINGLQSLIIQRGQKCVIVRESATSFRASLFSDSFSGPTLPGYIHGLSISASSTSPNNNIDVSTGAAGSEDGNLIQVFSTITKNTTALWAAGSGNGALDQGSIQVSALYYVWLIQRSDTGMVDVLVSLSATSPQMPTNYDRKRRIGLYYRRSSINNAFSYETLNQSIGVNQIWGDYSGPRSVNTAYQNTTGKPIMVSIRTGADTGTVEVSETTDSWVRLDRAASGADLVHCQFIVPNGHFYRLSGGSIDTWSELR